MKAKLRIENATRFVSADLQAITLAVLKAAGWLNERAEWTARFVKGRTGYVTGCAFLRSSSFRVRLPAATGLRAAPSTSADSWERRPVKLDYDPANLAMRVAGVVWHEAGHAMGLDHADMSAAMIGCDVGPLALPQTLTLRERQSPAKIPAQERRRAVALTALERAEHDMVLAERLLRLRRKRLTKARSRVRYYAKAAGTSKVTG